MKSFVPSVLVLASVLATPARAQEAAPAGQEALARLVAEQMRRIEALEARLASLQAEVGTLKRPQPAALAEPAGPTAPAEAAAEAARDAVVVDHAVGGEPPREADPEAPNADLPRSRPVDGYGSLRVAALLDADDNRDIRDNSSRIGLRGERAFTDWLTVFGRLEYGTNIVSNDRAIITGDPGAPIGQGSQALFSRLGFVGVGTGYGSLAWGKQWSAYYDVAEFTDQLQIWSGLANGAFAARSDGGIAGTGRPEHALQYRLSRQRVQAALQAQSRTSSPNDQGWIDTWGASLVLGGARGLRAGAAYNEVRDGVESPNPNQPKLGDKAALFGLRYRGERFYAAASYAVTEQHEIDDLGRRFDGRGLELALRYDLGSRFWLEAGYNDLEPDSEHPGEYRLRYGVGIAVFTFGTGSRVFAGFKLEDSRRSDGSKGPKSAFATGMNLTF
jgi:predicted porin